MGSFLGTAKLRHLEHSTAGTALDPVAPPSATRLLTNRALSVPTESSRGTRRVRLLTGRSPRARGRSSQPRRTAKFWPPVATLAAGPLATLSAPSRGEARGWLSTATLENLTCGSTLDDVTHYLAVTYGYVKPWVAGSNAEMAPQQQLQTPKSLAHGKYREPNHGTA